MMPAVCDYKKGRVKFRALNLKLWNFLKWDKDVIYKKVQRRIDLSRNMSKNPLLYIQCGLLFQFNIFIISKLLKSKRKMLSSPPFQVGNSR